MKPRREAFAFDVDGARLVGTRHVPTTSGWGDVGFLFVNFGYVPRDGHGGIAAKTCDRLAAHGFHAFRVDLPGLGDSEGELPEDSDAWFRGVRRGDLAAPTLAAVDCIRARFALDRIVLGGLCAASTTAIYAFDRAPASFAGLVLLEPETFLMETPPQGRTQQQRPCLTGRARAIASKVFSSWTWMRIAAGESRYGRLLPLPRWVLRRLLSLEHERLPEMTNMPLVEAWQAVVRRAPPMFVVTAAGKLREVWFDRVNAVAVPGFGAAPGVEHLRLPGTNHVFTTGGAIDIVADRVAAWADATFGGAHA